MLDPLRMTAALHELSAADLASPRALWPPRNPTVGIDLDARTPEEADFRARLAADERRQARPRGRVAGAFVALATALWLQSRKQHP
jgi:hypothetical protein